MSGGGVAACSGDGGDCREWIMEADVKEDGGIKKKRKERRRKKGVA